MKYPKFLQNIALVLAISLSWILTPSVAWTQIRSIKYNYAATTGRVKFTWQSSQAGAKYRFEIKDRFSQHLFSSEGRRNFINIKDSILKDGETYTATVSTLDRVPRVKKWVRSKVFVFSTRIPTPEQYLSFKTQNSGGRRGKYFLPEDYRLRTLPVMLLLHGSSVDGDRVASIFKRYAREREFIILAPDSVHEWGWEISTDGMRKTEDQNHINDCWDELLALPHLSIDSNKVLVAGISAGGAVAAYLGSNENRYTALAVLHGGVDVDSVGTNFVPVWLSTGSIDELRTPEEVSGYLPAFKLLSFIDVSYYEFQAAHAIPEEERRELVEWWLMH